MFDFDFGFGFGDIGDVAVGFGFGADQVRPVVVDQNNPLIQHHHDSQNVHDSKVCDKIASDYQAILNQNRTADGVFGAESALSRLRFDAARLRLGPDTISKFQRSLDTITTRSGYIGKLNATEEDVLVAAVNNIYHTRDDPTELVSVLVENLANCQERGHTVCSSGTVANIISSFAHIDESGIGVLKTRENIRNEIYAAVGHKQVQIGDALEGYSREQKIALVDAVMKPYQTELTEAELDTVRNNCVENL